MMRNVVRALAVLIGIGAFSPVATSDEIKIVAPILGVGLQSADGTGLYPKLARTILGAGDGKYSYTAVPLKRALVAMSNGSADCLFGMDKNLLSSFDTDTDPLLESGQVLLTQQFVFTRRGDQRLSGLKSLSGKSVAILAGSNLEEELRRLNVRTFKVSTQEAKLRMLALGRVDAIIGWMPDMFLSADENGFERPEFDQSAPLAMSKVTFVCRDNEKGKRLIQSANTTIQHLKQDGIIQKVNDTGWKLF
ncbi:substrate-binding periplasmic protein [Roseibium sediminicola]|uniref:Transporter substrate-binding domain-containing protein n=1 Tax=Roseibium sediminicola TaxID=2933272 RepID=A0ABT0GW48_9HYPH|nr:transporter substrate-binding domain-containing protein [Roseibium sp. CAU 1639]MCK7613670.1 transporter substrate-binding domain-containing protein [Roseibium sp. CAU 1639]